MKISKLRTQQKSQNGFTIIELLIVMVVILVMGTLVVITQSGLQTKNRDNERKADITQISHQLEAYSGQNFKYPTLAQLNDNDTSNPASFVSKNMKGINRENFRDPSNKSATPYALVSVPTNKTYSYAVTPANCDNGAAGDCTGYTLTATLESGGTFTQHQLN